MAACSYVDREDNDLYYSPGTLLAARYACGGAVEAVKCLFEDNSNKRIRCSDGKERRGSFAIVRPPGHHCSSKQAAGFCFFNNACTAVEYARRHHGIKRIAVVDTDYHPGDGTQSIFYDQDILKISIHVAARVR